MSEETGEDKTVSNDNFNNNHNTAETDPLHEDVTKQGQNAVAARNEVFKETKEVVRRFLEGSVNSNAKYPMPSRTPSGYHHSRRSGELPYYQRQQSKPEQGTLARKDSRLSKASKSNLHRKTANDQGYHTLPSRPSLNELTSASKKNFLSDLAGQDQDHCQSDTDVQTSQSICKANEIQEQSPEKLILFQLMNSESYSGRESFHPSESSPSTSESERHLRTESFSKAVSSSKSVISFLESKKAARRRSSDDVEVQTTSHKESVRRFSLKESEMPATSSSHRLESSLDMEDVFPQVHRDPDHKDGAGRVVEKKTTFGDKLRKKFMPSSSNKRKVKNKKKREQPKTDEPVEVSRSSRLDDQRSLPFSAEKNPTSSEVNSRSSEHRTPSSPVTTSSRSVGKEVASSSSSKHKTTTSRDRSPSPSKSKPPVTPKLLLRSLSLRTKFSPKPKRKPNQQFSSTNVLSPYSTTPPVGRQLEKHKSGSLPMSMRYAVEQQARPSMNERRHSEDFLRPERSLSPPEGSALPVHLDSNKKPKRPSKLKRLILRTIFSSRKRHLSESSNASSHSLPSIPAAVEQENKFLGVEDEAGKSVGGNQAETQSDGDKLSSSGEHSEVYHHRGSLSLSSGDLDGLSNPEKQQVIDEIAETLRRLSSKYNRYIQRQSSQPGRKSTTPESSLSSQEYHRFAKESRSSSPSRQTSSSSIKGPVHNFGKSYRKFKNESQPALTAFYNIRNQGRTTDSHLDKMPRALPTRSHIRHKPTGSLDSPYSTERHVRSRSNGALKPDTPLAPASTNTSETPRDVADGTQSTKSTQPIGDGDWESTDECTETDCAVRSFHPRSHPIMGSTTSNRHGSDVDAPSSTPLSSVPAGHLLMESQPSTSKKPDEEGRSTGSSSEPIDEDKLVDLLVEALIKKGDEFTRSIDESNGIPLEPVVRSSIMRYMSRVSYHHFEHFAKRFCRNVKQLVETSATRHAEVFPVVMVFNMTQLIVNMACSETTQSAVTRVLSLSTELVTNIVQDQGNDWGEVLAQLQSTEDDLAQGD